VFDWTGSVLALAWSPDGRYLATGDQDATVHFWIVSTGRDLQMSGYEVKVRELAWDSSSRFLATGGGAELVIWDCSGKGPQGTRPLMLEGHEDLVSAVAWQPGSELLASGGRDGAVLFWRPRVSVKPVARWASRGEVTGLTWTADGFRIAIGDGEGRLATLRVAT
jgi:WD40 repeat protein